MRLLSTEPIVLIGPGSEWFWSMAQFVVVAATLLGIYYQFRLQRGANAFEQMSRLQAEWSSEPMTRAKLRIARAIKAGETPNPGPAFVMSQFWDRVAGLVRGGYVDARVVHEHFGAVLRLWWSLLEDETRQARLVEGAGVNEHFEWLAGVFDGFAAHGGVPTPMDRATRSAMLPVIIAAYEDQIRMAEESRIVPKRVTHSRHRLPDTTVALEAPAAS